MASNGCVFYVFVSFLLLLLLLLDDSGDNDTNAVPSVGDIWWSSADCLLISQDTICSCMVIDSSIIITSSVIITSHNLAMLDCGLAAHRK